MEEIRRREHLNFLALEGHERVAHGGMQHGQLNGSARGGRLVKVGWIRPTRPLLNALTQKIKRKENFLGKSGGPGDRWTTDQLAWCGKNSKKMSWAAREVWAKFKEERIWAAKIEIQIDFKVMETH
jgi:hypothetical protein